MNIPRTTDSTQRALMWGVILTFLLAACTSASVAGTDGNGAQATGQSDPTINSATTSTRLPPSRYADYRIVTLLPRDAIPAIDNPEFVSAPEADRSYDLTELVIGVEFDGEARAYSVPFLSRHEIVNDTVGGVKIAVTW